MKQAANADQAEALTKLGEEEQEQDRAEIVEGDAPKPSKTA